jgi:hypothetical protein
VARSCPNVCVIMRADAHSHATAPKRGSIVESQSELLAVVVDRLLHDPELRPILKTIAAGLPADSSFVEKLKAARRDADALLDRMQPEATHGPAPDWMRMATTAALVSWGVFRDAATCSHQPHPARPQPVYAAAFRPGLVTCQRCIPALIDGTDPHRCDRCGETKAETCLMGSMQLGAMTWLFHVCRSCSVAFAQSATKGADAE